MNWYLNILNILYNSLHIILHIDLVLVMYVFGLFQALKSEYFINKPYPTPNHLLPMIGNTKKEIMDQCKPSLKRKIDGEAGMFTCLITIKL